MEAAIWFHDLIYDARAKDNEERSAEAWRDAATNARLYIGFVENVVGLILATKHAAAPAAPDAMLVVDIDLSMLGQPAQQFNEYEHQIRQEYAWVQPAAFAAGHAKVLKSFLDRAKIYSTPHFHAKYEARARENLARSLKQLEPL